MSEGKRLRLPGQPQRRLVFSLIPRTHEYSFPRLSIFDDVLSAPYFAKLSHTSFCIVKGLHHLNEMELPIVLHLVDAKGQLNSDGDRTIGGDTAPIVTRM
jgi:hypothetical protein